MSLRKSSRLNPPHLVLAAVFLTATISIAKADFWSDITHTVTQVFTDPVAVVQDAAVSLAHGLGIPVGRDDIVRDPFKFAAKAIDRSVDHVTTAARTATAAAATITYDANKLIPPNVVQQVQQAAANLQSTATAAGQQVANGVNQAAQGIGQAVSKGASDTANNVNDAVNDLTDAGKALERFAVNEAQTKVDAVKAAEKRFREGKVIDAVWHLGTETLVATEKDAAKATQESAVLAIAAQIGATAYGGPGGAAAYAAWATYNATGDLNAAMRAAVIAGLINQASAAASQLPDATAMDTAAKYAAHGAVGAAGAAAQGDDAGKGFVAGAAGGLAADSNASTAEKALRQGASSAATVAANGGNQHEIGAAFAAGFATSASQSAAQLPSNTPTELVQKAIITGAIGGLAVAASGGDQVAVRDAFLKSGGAVLVQDGITRKAVAAGQNAANDAAGYAINAISPEVTAKFKAAAATAQDLAQQVDKQAAVAAHWKDAAQASATKLAFGDWNVSWDPAKLRTGADVAIVLTYVGTGRVAEIPSSIPPTPALTPYADVGATLASSGGAAANSMVKALAAAYRSAYYDFKERSSPLPDKIRQNLAPYFSAEVLDAARYAVGTVTIKVGTATLDLQEAAGPNAFVSIGELMIFRSDPTSDLVSLEWIAHALQHSMQFRNAGEYEPFAKTVLTNGTAIETEARAVQMRVHDYYATHPPTGDPLYIVGSFRFLPDGPLYSVLSDDTIAIVSAASYKIVGVRVASSIGGSLPWMIHLGNGIGPDAAVATNGDILVNLGDGGGWNSKSSSFIPHRTQLLVPRADG